MNDKPPPATVKGRRGYGFRRHAAIATTLTMVLGTMLAVIVLPASPAAASYCRQHVRIWSIDRDLYVSVELQAGEAFPGMLRARAKTAGPWEMFTMCNDGLNRITLKSEANGLFVAVEHDYPGIYRDMLRARTPADRIGGWERFILEDYGDVVAFRTDRNQYVTSEQGFPDSAPEYGMLRGNRDVLGPWEYFQYYTTSV